MSYATDIVARLRNSNCKSLADTIEQQGYFLTERDVLWLAGMLPATRLLVRCGRARFVVTADQCQTMVDTIGESSDYVRDVSLPVNL